MLRRRFPLLFGAACAPHLPIAICMPNACKAKYDLNVLEVLINLLLVL